MNCRIPVLLLLFFLLFTATAQDVADTVQIEKTPDSTAEIHSVPNSSLDSSAAAIDTVADSTQVDSLTADSTLQDSISPKEESADTVRDSSEIEEERLKLLARLRDQSRYLYTHPKTADTLFNPYKINRISYSRDDYFTWNEVLRGQGEFTPIYYSPRHHFNKPLWRGYTIPLTTQQHGLLEGPATMEQFYPNYEPLQVQEMTLSASGNLTSTLFPTTWVSPQVYFLMENGLFEGNTLELRVMRNITRHISLALFSSFRNLNRMDYSQSRSGGMYGFYRGMSFVDTNNLVNNGRNPYSENHTTVVHAQWHKHTKFDFIYRYQGLSNDLIYPFNHDTINKDSDYDTIWYNRNGFNSDFRTTGNIPMGEKVILDIEGEVHESVHRESPVSTNLVSKSDKRKGEQQYQGAGSKLSFAVVPTDTISIRASVNRSKTTHTNNKNTTVMQTVLRAGNHLASEKIPLDIEGEAGTTILHANGENEYYPHVSGTVRFTPGIFALEGWGKLDIVPVNVPFDSNQIPLPGYIGDNYLGAGLRNTVAGKHLALTAGYSYIFGIDDATVAKYWQNQMAPYSNPGHVLTLTPSFGEWHGISLSSSWILSDTKPYLKSTSRLDFHINKDNRTRHFYTSFYLNFWSERDELLYVDRSNWNKPIYDLGTKLTAEIKSFRLFMKIDNILNRNNSYVPGYYMPGFTIRWGFAWTITG